jgi:hypothetical protein
LNAPLKPPKPQVIAPDFEAIAKNLAPLVAKKRWLVWRFEFRGGRWTKPPRNIKGATIDIRDPASLCSFEEAKQAYEVSQHGPEESRWDGVGYSMDQGDASFDLDKCRNPETCVIDYWAIATFEDAQSYCELTPSGTGARVIGFGQGGRVNINRKVEGYADGAHFEIYRNTTRYITVTGLQVPNFEEFEPSDINELLERLVVGLGATLEEPQGALSAPADNLPLPDESDLDLAAMALIRECTPGADRSAHFHQAVCRLRDENGLAPSQIEALMRRYPDGVVAKYMKRLREEIERSWRKVNNKKSDLRREENGDIVNYSSGEVIYLSPQVGDNETGPHHNRPPASTISAHPFKWCDPATIPRREWIYGRHFIRSFVGTTISPGGIGKSSLEIAEALAMVSGKPLLDEWPHGRFNVWYWNGEDPMDELKRRIMATAVHYGLSREDFERRLFVNSGRETEIIIAEQTRDGVKIAAPAVEAIKREIFEKKIDVVIIDPFVSSHHVAENDNPAIDRVAKTWAKIADVTKCAIELVHHSRKTNGAEVTAEDGRGASSLLAATRSGRVLNVMSKEEAAHAGVDKPRLYFRADYGKANLAPPPDDGSEWFHLASVSLGNGTPGIIDDSDSVGVVTRWQWPVEANIDQVPASDLLAIQQEVAKGNWRENVQAKEWVGKAIAKVLKLDVKHHKGRIKRLLETWIDNGILTVETRNDKKGTERSFVNVGEWVTISDSPPP